MKCEEVKLRIPEYIEKQLDENASDKIRNHIEQCESCRETYTDLYSFLKFTDSFPGIEPPADMKEEFMMLAEENFDETKTRKLHIPDWMKVAASIIVVLATFAAGYFAAPDGNDTELLRAEMENLKQQVFLASLTDYSGPQKIEAVYNVASLGTTNTELTDALFYTLNSDKNINVRLAALNVLSGMINQNEKVKYELINSLMIQDNPLIQISLIQILTESGVKEAKDEIEYLTNSEDTDPNVKNFAKDMIKTII